MKKHLLIAFLLGLLEPSFGQQNLVALPGQGIVVGKDTIFLGLDQPQTVLSKIDTSSFPVSVNRDTGIVQQIFEQVEGGMATDGSDSPKDSSWAVYYYRITWSNSVIYEFEGTEPSSLVLNKIIVRYPIAATTPSGLSIGDPFKEVIDTYQKTRKSYNLGSNRFSYYCDDYGICFRSEIIKQRNKAVKIISGFEVYE